ncbi:MAG TPA: YncE family protein [Chloroflexia bacterium]
MAPATPPPSPAAPTGGPLRVLGSTDLALGGGTSRFDYQSLDPQTRLLFIAHLGASLVTVFDTRTSRVVADIPDIASVHGVLAVPSLGRVYASATGADQVAVIDEQTLKVVARIPGGSYPDGLAYDPAGKQVFVSDESGATDTVIDTATNSRRATIPLGGEAGNTQYDPVSGQMFVAVQSRNQLVALDPATNKVLGRTPLPGCEHDHGLLIDAPARRAFVACDGNARLLTLDLNAMRILDTQSVGDAPDVLALDPGWHRLYVAAESGVLSIFDAGGSVPRKLREGVFAPAAHSVAVDPATHRVYLPLANVSGRAVLRVVQYSPP